jgi:tetratricopeptide (TPR) repeat protein
MHVSNLVESRARAGLAALMGVILLATAPRAAADDRAEAARVHFRKAEKAFSLGRFEQALEQYETAYDLTPLPGLLFNMGQCYSNLGNGERAIFFYERYSQVAQDAEQREMVQALIVEERRRLAPPGAPTDTPSPPEGDVALPLDLPPVSAAPGVASVDREVPPALAARPTAAPGPRRPLYRRWWVWAAAGVVAGSAAAAAMLLRPDRPPSPGNLGIIDSR